LRVSAAVADPSANDRLARFRAIRAKLDPTGDPASTIGAFYVDSPHSVSARLAAELSIAPGSSHLLVGGVGSGKTTELLAELEVLQRVRTQGKFVHTSEDDLALLMTRRVLEYRSGAQPWYAVHPTIAWFLATHEELASRGAWTSGASGT
jgi:ABC-type glutathione transport system ATPase component